MPSVDSSDESSSTSNSSTSSEKDSQDKINTFTDNTDSGASLTFQPSRSEYGTPKNSSYITSPIILNSISEDVQKANKKNTDNSFTRFRLPTPEGSVYEHEMDASIETPEQEKKTLWR